jgi:hypothetical protein
MVAMVRGTSTSSVAGDRRRRVVVASESAYLEQTAKIRLRLSRLQYLSGTTPSMQIRAGSGRDPTPLIGPSSEASHRGLGCVFDSRPQ